AKEGRAALDRLARHVPKGVEDYFGQEIVRLRTLAKGKLAQDILGLLVVAAGGMTADEIAGALDKGAWDVAEALERIQRFLIGDKRVTLMHLQLRKVVGERMGAQRGSYEQQLLRWCARYQQQRWPDDTPTYVLLYYPEHLQAEQRFDA